MFRLAHFSDIHLGPLPQPAMRQLMSKRITGYINWKRNRAHHIGGDTLNMVADAIANAGADHVALTGDLVNLALDAEITAATEWLAGRFAGKELTVVPGNHDAYVPGALAKALHSWQPWMTGDGGATGFPFLRRRGDIAIIGVSTARATMPFMATGYFRKLQANRLRAMLADCGRQGLCRVVLIHHPPLERAAAPHKRLNGQSLFRKTVLEAGAELVLHGHTHLPTLGYISGGGKQVPVCGVSAAGQGPGGREPPGGFNLFDLEREGGRWIIGLQRHIATGPLVDMEAGERQQILG